MVKQNWRCWRGACEHPLVTRHCWDVVTTSYRDSGPNESPAWTGGAHTRTEGQLELLPSTRPEHSRMGGPLDQGRGLQGSRGEERVGEGDGRADLSGTPGGHLGTLCWPRKDHGPGCFSRELRGD